MLRAAPLGVKHANGECSVLRRVHRSTSSTNESPQSVRGTANTDHDTTALCSCIVVLSDYDLGPHRATGVDSSVTSRLHAGWRATLSMVSVHATHDRSQCPCFTTLLPQPGFVFVDEHHHVTHHVTHQVTHQVTTVRLCSPKKPLDWSLACVSPSPCHLACVSPSATPCLLEW